MRPNRLRELWKEGKPAVAGWIGSGSSYLAEVMANAGYDAIVIDMQHGAGITVDRAVACLQAISTTSAVPMVRVPWNDPAYIQYVLDAGAYGVVVPLVNNAQDAARAAGACKYPPLGYRSAGPNRARLYGGPDYLQHANEEVLCFVMIETQEAVDNLEEIARVPGVDGFYIGPSDLAISLGVPMAPDNKHPKHVAACQRVLEVARAHGLVPGIHSSGPEEVARRFNEGWLFSQVGSDVQFVSMGAASGLKALAEARAKYGTKV